MSRSFGHVQLGYHPGAILVPLLTCVLLNVEVFGLYDVIQLPGYDLVSCSLAVRSSQEMNRWRYSGDNPSFPVMSLRPGRFTVFRRYVTIEDPIQALASSLIFQVVKLVG